MLSFLDVVWDEMVVIFLILRIKVKLVVFCRNL